MYFENTKTYHCANSYPNDFQILDYMRVNPLRNILALPIVLTS